MKESRTLTTRLASHDNPVTITISGIIPDEYIGNTDYISDVKDMINTLWLACNTKAVILEGEGYYSSADEYRKLAKMFQ